MRFSNGWIFCKLFAVIKKRAVMTPKKMYTVVELSNLLCTRATLEYEFLIFPFEIVKANIVISQISNWNFIDIFESNILV